MHFDFQNFGDFGWYRYGRHQKKMRFTARNGALLGKTHTTSGQSNSTPYQWLFKKDVINYQSRTILNIFAMRRSFSSIIRNTMKTEL